MRYAPKLYRCPSCKAGSNTPPPSGPAGDERPLCRSCREAVEIRELMFGWTARPIACREGPR